MKRNVVFLVIDSLSYKTLESYPFPEELFINNFIKKNSIIYNNVYTQGPYTEASMNGLAYGQRALDNSAFMYSHTKYTHSFVDNIHPDYKTFFAGMSCRLFVDHCSNSFDKFHYHFYTPTTLPTLQWNRVKHFSNLSKKRNLTELEIECLKNLINYGLNDTDKFLTNLINQKYETSLSHGLIRKNDLDSLIKRVNDLKNEFLNNENAFISRVLKEEINFADYDFNYYIPYNNEQKIKDIYNKYRPKLLRTMKNHYSFSLADLKVFFSNNHKGNYIKDFIKCITDKFRKKKGLSNIYNKLLLPDANVKKAISFDKSINQIEDFLKNQKENNNTPFFIYCQPDDFHPPAVFWTYDSENEKVLENELSTALNLANRIKTKNVNIFDYLSLFYLDKKIEYIFDLLIKDDLLNSTDVIITADHGSWFFYDSLRLDDSLIMTEERMHIPCMFYRANLKREEENNLHNSYSLPNSILKFMGYKTDDYFFGKSFDEDKNEFLISENLGFGCPDIYNTKINYVVHNEKYKLNIETKINEELTLNNCKSFYYLESDPLEQINAFLKAKNNDAELISRMFKIAQKRHQELNKNTNPVSFYRI